jgi:hypothetical protein
MRIITKIVRESLSEKVQKLTDKMPIYINDLYSADIPTVLISLY